MIFRNAILLLLVLFSLNCNSTERRKVGQEKEKDMKASKENLYQDVNFLTQLSPARNHANLNSLEKAATFIEEEFKEAGLSVENQYWTVSGKKYQNVIASYNAGKKERLIIGAHYDVCGDQAGADDNASGVAGLLELARLIAKNKPLLNYRIDFVAYSLEEPPHFGTEEMGSFVHAQSLKDNKIPVIGMFCFEMIGYFSDKPGSQEFPSPEMAKLYPDKGDFIIVVGLDKQSKFSEKVHTLMKSAGLIDVQKINFPVAVGLGGLSDHRNYWHFDFPAVMINDTSFLRNPNYHKKSDTIKTLDFDKMAAVVNTTYNAAVHIQ